MKALSDERWQEIRGYGMGSADSLEQIEALFRDVLQQHDHLAAQIKLLADYIMSERPEDPAWAQGEGACDMAVAIMKREKPKITNGEPVFVLRAQDELAPQTVSFWAALAYNKGVNHNKVMSADCCAVKMKEWKNRKLPD